jgi:hypothetical protein
MKEKISGYINVAAVAHPFFFNMFLSCRTIFREFMFVQLVHSPQVSTGYCIIHKHVYTYMQQAELYEAVS